MALGFTYAEAANPNPFTTDTWAVWGFYPTGVSPASQRARMFQRFCWQQEGEPPELLFRETNIVTRRRFAWGTRDTTPFDDQFFGSYFLSRLLSPIGPINTHPGNIGRVTSIDGDLQPIVKGFYFRDEASIVVGSSFFGPSNNCLNAELLFNVEAASELAGWVWPTPKYLHITTAGFCRFMSNSPPASSHFIPQPHMRNFRRRFSGNGGQLGLGYEGIGRDPRVLVNDPGGIWRKQGVANGHLWDPVSFNAYHGIPPMEISGGIRFQHVAGPPTLTVSSLDLVVDLYEYVLGSAVPTITEIVRHAVAPGAVYMDGGLQVIDATLQPIDSGHSATLANDTTTFDLRARWEYTTNAITVLFDVPYLFAPLLCMPYQWAVSGAFNGETGYMPGWLWDPNA